MPEVGAFFDEFVQGGLLDDSDVTLKSARWVQWNYNGKIQVPVLALKLDNVDAEGNVHTDHLSSGELKNFVPSSDGKKAIPVGQQSKLNINTNGVAFIVSVMNADTRGQMAAKLKTTDDISILDGMRYHLLRVNQPKRAGLQIQAPEVAGQPATSTKVPQVVTCTAILAYPWEAGAVAQAPAAAPAAAPVQYAAPAAAPVAAANGIDQMAVETVIRILGGNGGSVPMAMLAGKVFQDSVMATVDPAVRNQVLAAVVQPAFLTTPGRPFKFDGTTVSF